MGDDIWEEALSDMIQESCIEALMGIGEKVYFWKLFNLVPEPENKDKIVAEIREGIVKTVNFIQTVAEQKGKLLILSYNVSKMIIIMIYCIKKVIAITKKYYSLPLLMQNYTVNFVCINLAWLKNLWCTVILDSPILGPKTNKQKTQP